MNYEYSYFPRSWFPQDPFEQIRVRQEDKMLIDIGAIEWCADKKHDENK